MFYIRILLLSTLTFVMLFGAGLLWLRLSHYKILSVQSASMLPTFRPGDALIIAPPKTLRADSVISYRYPSNPNITITHRLISVNKQTGLLTTAGDAERSKDLAFSKSLVTGQAVAVLPGLGSVLDKVHQPAGLITFVYAPATLIILTEVYLLSRSYARPIYSVRL